MEEAQLVSWESQIGDYIELGVRMATVETDKALLDIAADVSGYLVAQVAKPGDMIACGDIIAYISEQPPQSGSVNTRQSGRLIISPAARKLAAAKRVDLAGIAGTGPRGRIVLRDVIAAEAVSETGQTIANERDKRPPPAPGATSSTSCAKTADTTDDRPDSSSSSLRKPVSRMRRIIAERLTHSFRNIPQFQVSRSADLTNVMRIRKTLLNSVEHSTGIKLSVLDFVIQAAARSLRRVPQLNVSYYDEASEPYIMEHNRVNIGLAVALPNGLVVPVIQDADSLSLVEIARQRDGLASAAKSGRLLPDQCTGGTFTISSLASYDAEQFTALVNPPEAGILAVGKAKPTPVVKGESVQAVPLLNLTCSFDHRPLDGATGALFMQELVQQLESDRWMIV